VVWKEQKNTPTGKTWWLKRLALMREAAVERAREYTSAVLPFTVAAFLAENKLSGFQSVLNYITHQKGVFYFF